MVPGRVQTMNSDEPLPTDELMIRWAEASAFFPFLQFSYFPWNYGEGTAAAVLGSAKVHKALEAYIAEQAAERVKPLLRPVWYDGPGKVPGLRRTGTLPVHEDRNDPYTIPDQFMLGSDLLVAPVLDEGVTARDVVLPPGEWVDAWTGETVSGVLSQWPAPCPGIPLFVRVDNHELLATLQPALAGIQRDTVASGVTTATWQAGLNRDLNVTG